MRSIENSIVIESLSLAEQQCLNNAPNIEFVIIFVLLTFIFLYFTFISFNLINDVCVLVSVILFFVCMFISIGSYVDYKTAKYTPETYISKKLHKGE